MAAALCAAGRAGPGPATASRRFQPAAHSACARNTWRTAWPAPRRLHSPVLCACQPVDSIDDQQAEESAESGWSQLKRYHHVLPPSLTTGRRVLIVGDLHGCFDELQDLLAKCGYRPGQDVVLSVGDLVNKGPDSLAVLRWFAKGGPLVRAVRGNHDIMALRSYRRWLAGEPQTDERSRWVREMGADLAAYLDRIPLSLRLPAYKVLVVHAGLVPGVHLSEQLYYDHTSIINCVAVRCEPEAAAADEAEATKGSEAATSSSPPAGSSPLDAGGQPSTAAADAVHQPGGASPVSSLSSFDFDGSPDLDGWELAASAGIPSSSAGSGRNGSSSSGGSGSSAESGGNGSSSSGGSGSSNCAESGGSTGSGSTAAAAVANSPVSRIRERAAGLQWRDALLAYAQRLTSENRQGSGQEQVAAATAGPHSGQPDQQQRRQQRQQQARAAGRPLQQDLRVELLGTKRHTIGVPWARAWSEFQRAAPQRHAWVTYGCTHAVFGHDARRLLQLERCATGIDGGCVHGKTLYCLLLPPLDEDGQPLLEQAWAPPDAQQIQLCSGLPAYIVGVPARRKYAPMNRRLYATSVAADKLDE